MFNWVKGFLIIFTCFFQVVAWSQDVIPDELKPWTGWVLKGYEDRVCPRPFNQDNKFLCDWPAELQLNIAQTQADFVQKGILYQDGWLMLPGERQYWPLEVKLGKQLLSVVEINGRPFIYLQKGAYQIEGKFNFNQTPERLAIPQSIALVHLSLNQSKMTAIDRDKTGYLWLKRATIEKGIKEETDSLSIKVYRKLRDAIPQENLSLLRIKVTGKEREALIGPVISDQMLPININTSLPARLEENGQLRLQVRPGTWDIYINSRYLHQSNHFEYVSSGADWPTEEVWSFEAKPEFRQVEVKDAISIDPSQTDMPGEWRQYPSYLMKEGLSLSLEEKQRGKISERGENLQLTREAWLDFDGKGMTFRDQLNGVIEENWRLSLLPPLQLGRVTINGEDQLITTLPDNQQPGVEIRNGYIHLLAMSRLASRTQQIPAIGWHRDVNQLKTILHLPPGWKLLNVMGVDKVSNAWLRNWNLLDLFLVLLIGLSVFKLLGVRWGLFALLTLVLTYQEPSAPVYSWLAVLAGLGVLRVIPEGAAMLWVKGYTVFFLFVLMVIAIPFIATQLQTAVYPQLNPPDTWVQPQSDRSKALVMEGMADSSNMVGGALSDAREIMSAPMQAMKSTVESVLPKVRQEAMKTYDPNAKIQTGPGVPHWAWQGIEMNWQGPVSSDHAIRLWIMPAWIVSIMKFIQVFLVLGLIVGLTRAVYARYKKDQQEDGRSKSGMLGGSVANVFVIPFIMLVLNALPMQDASAEVPDPTTLQELRDYLLQAPKCMPNCADYQKAHISIQSGLLTVRLMIQAVEAVAVPLPHHEKGWGLDTILVDGHSASALKKDEQGHLWIYLEKGTHEILMSGKVDTAPQFEIAFSLVPKMVSVDIDKSEAWSVSGLTEERLIGQSLQFNRTAVVTENSLKDNSQSLSPREMPVFVSLTRTIRLGLDWEVMNEINRISPQSGVIHISIPLLKDEKILSSNVKVINNQAQIQLSAGQARAVWYTKLPITPLLQLSANDSANVKEIWQLQASPIWHVQFKGIPLIHQQSNVGQWLPVWHPWPKEQLEIEVLKPEALAGNTLTIDSSRYTIVPGKRKSEYELEVMLRSSQGGQHYFDLPEAISIQDVLINDVSQAINLEKNRVNFPIHPGEQNVKLRWQTADALKSLLVSPLILLNSQSSNHVTQIDMSKDRWILFLGGPEIGPVVRYWAVLFLTVIIAIALGRSGLTPLATWQWLLLGLGVTLSTPLSALAVIAWFIVLQLRSKYSYRMNTVVFQLSQISIVILTAIFVISLLLCITNGLLGNPQMQLSAPQTGLVYSNFMMDAKYQLQWYQDQVHSSVPNVWILSIPLFVYRLLMLVWALWLAFSLLKWFQWAWLCFSKDGLWKNNEQK